MDITHEAASSVPVRHYAHHLADGVDLPHWAFRCFNRAELTVLGVVRDAVYRSSDAACSLSINEIAQLANVAPRTVIKAITIAIAAGVLEREGSKFKNRLIHYKVG